MTSGEKILASLDIGTNSTLFLVAAVDAGKKIRPMQHDVCTNDLGRGLDPNGNLSSEIIDRNIRLLENFKRRARKAGALEVRAAATEALRKAGNAKILIDRARAELGLDIRVVSGQEEAILTYRGILSGLSERGKPIIAVDVGGGSSEVIYGQGDDVHYSTSLPVGAISLDKKHIHHDPPLGNELEEVRREVDEILRQMPDSMAAKPCDLVICGGTASSLAAADLGLSSVQPEKIAGHVMTSGRLQRFIEQFSHCTLEERRRIPGIGRRRAEIILPGAILIDGLLRALGRQQYITSERGLRYGLLVE